MSELTVNGFKGLVLDTVQGAKDAGPWAGITATTAGIVGFGMETLGSKAYIGGMVPIDLIVGAALVGFSMPVVLGAKEDPMGGAEQLMFGQVGMSVGMGFLCNAGSNFGCYLAHKVDPNLRRR